ncbi:MAG: hypothetical protein RI958_2525 [Actinomycetota bacterium]|jgi:ribonuclease E
MDDTTVPDQGQPLAPSGDLSSMTSGGGAEATESVVDAGAGAAGQGDRPTAKKRRRGSRGGKGRKKPVGVGDDAGDPGSDDDDEMGHGVGADGADRGADASGGRDLVAPAPRASRSAAPSGAPRDGEPSPVSSSTPERPPRQPRQPRPPKSAGGASEGNDVGDRPELPELPERIAEGRPSADAAERALVRKPKIGDTRPAPTTAPVAPAPARGQRPSKPQTAAEPGSPSAERSAPKKRRRGGKGRAGSDSRPSQPSVRVDPEVLERRKGRERNGRPVGRYLMCVQVRPSLTQVAVLEGRNLIEHYVSRPADDISQIHGNIYLGKVQNVLPGMEAAFVDIGTPKNAVLYRGDVQYDAEDIEEKSSNLRIEQMLTAKQLIICQVTKNPIGAKGARLTQEVSLPGRFVVLIPNSKTYGISKRLPDDVRKRLRTILDRVKPAEHGLIVRTAAEHATEHELRADMTRLLDQWAAIEAKAKKANSPSLLYREPELAVRVIREEFNAEYRGVIIDDQRLHDDVKDYVSAFNPELADRIEFHDSVSDGLPLFERHHIHEQLHKALDRKVWLPSGGSLIIEHTEALTVIDVNTGKNVGTTNLEETVFRNNLEAADEVAKQLRLRDIGGIVVIDFIDMEIRENRKKVVDAFRSALARDKTRTQVFDISDLGLVEMTRKRIGEGLLTNFAEHCPNCEGRGVVVDHALLG